MNATVLKKLKVTNHGFERYCHRVSQVPVNRVDEERMTEWFRKAIAKGTRLPEPGENGATLYLYRGHKVVYDSKKNAVVSVLPYKPQVDEQSGYHDMKEEISSIVTKKLTKDMKVLRHQYRQLMIAIHKEEIKRLSVYNPNTQDTIAERVFKLQQEVTQVENKIKSVELVAEQYGAQL